MDDFKWRWSWYAMAFLLVPTFTTLAFALGTEKFPWFIAFYWFVFVVVCLACVSARRIMCVPDPVEDAVEDIP